MRHNSPSPAARRSGAAGYAAYQIPGVTPTPYGLTGSCGTPVNWTLYPPTAGSLTASGLYTAPAVITTNQTVTVTATSQSDPTQVRAGPSLPPATALLGSQTPDSRRQSRLSPGFGTLSYPRPLPPEARPIMLVAVKL